MPENIVNLDRICHTRPSQMENRPRHRNVISIEKGSVAIAFVREALDGVVRRGLDPADFLRRAAIAPELLTLDEARVSPDAFGTLWLDIASALDDEFFGLDTHRLKVGSFATLCHLTLHTRTLRDALQRGTRFLNLLLDDTRIEFDAGDELARLRRSEEHTSELQSLMRISYAVFCLK